MALGCVMTIGGKAQTLPMKPKTRRRFADVIQSHVDSPHKDKSNAGQAAQPTTAPPPSPPPSGKKVALWVGCILAGFAALLIIIGALIDEGEEGPKGYVPPPTPKPTPTMTDEEKYGWHCLSAWDGNHDGLEALIRNHLTDPGMETISTSTTPVNVNTEQHLIYMDFTAKNAFGGRVRHRASGSFDPNTCEATLFDIE